MKFSKHTTPQKENGTITMKYLPIHTHSKGRKQNHNGSGMEIIPRTPPIKSSTSDEFINDFTNYDCFIVQYVHPAVLNFS